MRAYLRIIFILAVLSAGLFFAQSRNDEMKRQGQVLMNDGRFGEAIDQFNKYITANPRLPDGYHLRALCFEQRLQYWDAVFDLRRALRLSPKDAKVRSDLDRITAVWHKQLYQKIEGHKRDLAVDPNNAFTYLEIGKSYRWLEEWYDAEQWYDEYLKRDDNASPDEIIRYTIILAKTRSIVKGERILKKYVTRYPNDWRLWSRYGYFTLWLGKNKAAEDAFRKSLSIKPFFEEAEDGLDLARRQPYLNIDIGRDRRDPASQEYAIDRYYRLLEKNPDDDDIRFDLLNELVKNSRYEEAFQQLQYLQPKYADEERFKTVFKFVSDYRDSTFNKDVDHYTELLKNNPSDKDAVVKLADAYANLFYYDSAIEILNEYLQYVPEDQDLDVRFKYAKYSAWNYEWEKSISQLDKLLELDPNNSDYKLLRGQIAVWTLNDLELGEQYLNEVHDSNPKNLEALLSLVNLHTWRKDFAAGKKYLDELVSYFPNNPEVANMESIFQLRQQADDETKLFEIRGEAGKLSMEGNCVDALAKYDEYFEKRKSLTREEKIEYAEIATCALQYKRAIELYDEIIKDGFDYEAALLRAKNYFLNNDTTKARTELESLEKMNPEDDQARLFLANTYAATNRLEGAESIYRELKMKAVSTAEKNDINLQLLFLAGNYIDAKKYEKGTRIYRELDTDTTSQEIKQQLEQRYIFLADTYAADKKYDLAVEEFEKLEKRITEPEMLNDLYKRQTYMGYLMTQDKEFELAEELFENLQTKITDTVLVYDLNEKILFLGDAYVQNEDYGDARSTYKSLLETVTDTSIVNKINQRIKWLPPSGFSKGFSSIQSFFNLFIPTNISVSPFGNFYADNQKFRLWNYGIRADAGFIGFLNLGLIWNKTRLNNIALTKDFTQLKGAVSIYFTRFISIGGTYGKMNTPGEPNYRVWDATIKYEKQNEILLSANFENTDARLFLYSPNMFYNRMTADVYRLNFYYNVKNLALFKTYYQYFNLSDRNKGNDFIVRLGRRFLSFGMFGYEYFFSDYAANSVYYYSPQDYATHSIWTEYDYEYKKEWKFKAGGKIGYAPAVDFVISEIFGEAVYNPIQNLIISATATYGNSFRYGSGYRSFNGALSAYWNLF
ncbi:MAG: tetratricopeptide TPR2 [Ignavibacteria bacterium]|nr:MAG: tetratricopeptide TPR2 [Ignavibacteria bacterium]KAF0158683.1 MAG: tetratricopeptide TPR2 [Ignavibacteria bacterium]